MVEVTPLRLNNVDITGTSLSKIGRAKAGETVARANLPPMVGATGIAAGQSGLVPAPQAGDEDRVLTGGGTYVEQTGGGAGGPTTPGVTTTGFLPKWGDNVGDSLDAGVAAPTGPIVGTTDTQTLSGKTLTTPTIASFVNAGHSHTNAAGAGSLDASAIASGLIATARLGGGTASSDTFLRGDQTYATPAGGGDVSGPGTSTVGNVPTYSGTSGTALDTGFPVSAAAKTVLDDASVSAMRTTLVVDPAGTDNSTPVSLAGTPDYITLAGQVLTRGPVDLATDVSGVLPHGNLGTGGGGATKFLREDSTYQTIGGGGDALTSGSLAQFAPTTSAELRGVLSDETGTGPAVFGTSPTLTTPALGTPTALVLTNATALPVAALTGAVAIANGGTGQTSQTAGMDALSPTTTKGDLLVDNGTSVVRRGVGTNGQILTADSAETDGVKWANPAGGGDALTASPLSQFAATTSAQLRGVLSDESGTGLAVFNDGPTLIAPVLGTPASATLTNATGLPTAGLVDDAVTNAKAANMAQATIKGRAAGAGTGDPTDLSAAQVLTLTGAEATANKGIASGYAPLDALVMVPTANLRPLAWDKIHYSFHATPGRASFDVQGKADRPMMDGVATYAPATGGAWIQLDSVGGHAGIITSLDVIQTRWSPTIQFSIKTPSSLTGCRFWFGIFQAIPDSTAPVANGAAFTIKSAAICWDATVHSGSNFWRSHTSDGTDATVVQGSVAIATGTDYKIRPVITPASISFYVNDTLIGAAHTTDLPGAGDELGIGMRGIGTFFWKRIDVIHD